MSMVCAEAPVQRYFAFCLELCMFIHFLQDIATNKIVLGGFICLRVHAKYPGVLECQDVQLCTVLKELPSGQSEKSEYLQEFCFINTKSTCA